MIKQSDPGSSAVTDNIQNIQSKICVLKWLIMCVLHIIISRLLLGELGEFRFGSCGLAAILVLFQLLHFCLVITAQQQAIQQLTSAMK